MATRLMRTTLPHSGAQRWKARADPQPRQSGVRQAEWNTLAVFLGRFLPTPSPSRAVADVLPPTLAPQRLGVSSWWCPPSRASRDEVFLGISEQIVAPADAGRATGEVHIGGATAGRDASC